MTWELRAATSTQDAGFRFPWHSLSPASGTHRPHSPHPHAERGFQPRHLSSQEAEAHPTPAQRPSPSRLRSTLTESLNPKQQPGVPRDRATVLQDLSPQGTSCGTTMLTRVGVWEQGLVAPRRPRPSGPIQSPEDPPLGYPPSTLTAIPGETTHHPLLNAGQGAWGGTDSRDTTGNTACWGCLWSSGGWCAKLHTHP